MNIAHSVASKLFVAFVAAAMLFTLVTPAKAATAEELQQMINDLLAQVATLQGQLGQGGSTPVASGVCPYTWTRSLTTGDSGMDVMKLQQFLNADPDTRVAATGVGSAGMETQYFGGLTAAAVSKFQLKYRSDVLSPLGLVNATGYFGPSSMAKANMLCTSAMTDDSDDSMDDADDSMDDSDDSDSSVELSGEASLGDTDLKDGDDTDIEEGQDDAPVAEFEVEFTNGDAKISRIDVELDASGTEEDAWDTFSSVSLWVDGDKVAEMDADSENDWLNDEKTLRFSGLDIVSMEDDTTVITIGVTTANSIDNLPATWNVDVTSIRYVDADDVTTTEDPAVATTDFTISEAGADDELLIKSSSADPDATTLAVETSSNSDWYTVFAFDLDTDDSTNDILVDTITATVTVSGDVYNQVVNDAQLVIDGQTFDDFTVANGTTATATLTFDIDKDLEIAAGDRVTAELQLEFTKVTGNYSEGQTVVANVNETGWAAEGADDLTVGTQLDGSATGETHTLRSSGVIVEPSTTSADTQGDTDATGIFTIKFDVTAFEGDFYVAENATSTNASGDGGVYFSVEGPTGFSATTSGVLASTADEETTGVFTVREGETETFTLTVTVDTDTTGQHRVLLNDIWYSASSDGVTSVKTDPATPASDYRTDYVNVNAS